MVDWRQIFRVVMSIPNPKSSPLCAPRAARILGTGAALPEEAVLSVELDRRLGLAAGTVERKTGVRVRYFETRRNAAALGAEAALRALADAGLSFSDIDCLVAASGTPDQAMPSNAALIHRELASGGSAIPAFDIGASCLGFLAALDMMACLIEAGRYHRVLIVASDIASCGLDWSKLEASGIFGDGAAAAVLGPAGESGSALLASAFATYSEGVHFCEIPAGGSRHHPSRVDEPFLPLSRFRMDGKAVFRLAATHLPGFLAGLLATAGVGMDEISVVVPHQASRHGLEYLRRQLGVERERIIDLFAGQANQVAASLPSALDAAIRSGRLRRGETALLIGSGAGLCLGGAVLHY
jgi:3-oxoacyl-[acyl-carrier-protein] synthase-3